MNSSSTDPDSAQITATAPGKVVLSGEYAVLEGGPAIVASMNRRAQVTLQTTPTGAWTFAGSLSSQHYTTKLHQVLTGPLPATDHPAFLPIHVVRALHESNQDLSWPEHLHVYMDTSALFDADGSKFGLGSSAALCTALVGALAELVGAQVSLSDIVVMHRQFQGGKGSGLDIAAALEGGVIEYRLDEHRAPLSKPFTMNEELHFTYYWTGVSANTGSHLTRLQDWLDVSSPTVTQGNMQALISAATNVAESGFSIPELGRFANSLHALDQMAKLGIYAGLHENLHTLAKGYQVVYKPCGAGGGDLGLAASNDPAALNAYTESALGMGVRAIALETDPNGLIVYRG